CGSSPGTSPVHLEAARALAHAFHKANITLVYGGGTVGMMGEVARTLVSLSGPDSVRGIIPSALQKREQNGIDEATFGRTTIVKDMHTRKALMAKAVIEGGPGGGFIALSGGYGTLEELMEITTWNQLGIHGMGVVVFNVEGFWGGLLEWVRTAVSGGFISPSNGGILVEALSAEECVSALREYRVSDGRYTGLQWDEQ
ncbi:hypothetical protein M501DRAFT_931489, partial [Patellaria atrata CBS 101060]